MALGGGEQCSSAFEANERTRRRHWGRISKAEPTTAVVRKKKPDLFVVANRVPAWATARRERSAIEVCRVRNLTRPRLPYSGAVPVVTFRRRIVFSSDTEQPLL
jgi:hypothetical protein